MTKSAYVGIGLAKLNINLKDNNSQFITIRIVLFLGILQNRLFGAPVWLMTSLKDRKHQEHHMRRNGAKLWDKSQ